MNEKDLVDFVITSKILDEYRSSDESLNRLIDLATNSSGEWNTHEEDISVSTQSVLASETAKIFTRRLHHMPDETKEPLLEERMRLTRLRTSLQQLIDYCTANPTAQINTVLFNCPENSYDVFCRTIDQKTKAICVIVGKPVPAYAM